MKISVKIGLRLLSLLLVLESGCVTHALWTNGSLDAYKEPAQNPHLHLFESQQGNDFLVVYDENCERQDVIRTRAYWLNKNQKRVGNQHAPVFARNVSVQDLPSVPVFYSKPDKSDKSFYAVCETNQQSFTLFSAGHEIGSYNLPVYNDGWGRVEKTALMPFAASADAAVIGAYAAVFAWYLLAQNNTDFTVGK